MILLEMLFKDYPLDYFHRSDIELKQLDNLVVSYSTPSLIFPIEIGFFRDNEGENKYVGHFWRSWIKVE